MKTNEIFKAVTEKVIANLEKAGSWQALWAMPNPVSLNGRFYHGINFFNLACSDYSDTPVWGTFQQIRQNGGQVRKGQTGSLVVFWKMLSEIDPDTLKPKTHYLLRYYYVFNASQCDFDDLGKKRVAELSQQVLQNSNSCTRKAEEIIAQMPQRPEIQHPKILVNPCYSPSMDVVMMPAKSWYQSTDAYFSTLYHELCHSTGHPSRLNRFSTTEKLSDNKEELSKEELVAELGASYLAEIAGLKLNIDNAAAYIRGWSSRLRDNAGWIVWASSRAEKAANFILGKPVQTYSIQEEESTSNAVAEEPPHYGKPQTVYSIYKFDSPQIARVKIHKAWPVVIPGFEMFTFYVHKVYNTRDNHWIVTEAYTGIPIIGYHASRKEVIDAVMERLQHTGIGGVRAVIHDGMRKYGNVYAQRMAELDEYCKEIDIEDVTGITADEIRKLVAREVCHAG